MKKLFGLKTLSLTLSLGLLLSVVSSCSNNDSSFPEFSYPSDNTSTETSSTNADSRNNSEGIVELTVALPYSESTVNYLARLYYAKQNNLLGVDDTGSNVSLDFLDSLDLPFVVNSILTTSNGANNDSLLLWQESDEIPDIFMTSDLSSAVDEGLVLSLNDYLYDDDYITSGCAFSDMLNATSTDGSLYGLPYYFSTPVIVCSRDYLPDSGELDFRNSYDDFHEYLSDIDGKYNTDENHNSVIPFYSASSLTPYLSSAFSDGIMNSFMLTEDYSDKDVTGVLNSVVSNISDLYSSGLSSDTDENGADPRYSRTAASWLCSSSDLDMWSEYYDNNLYICQIPGCDDTSPVTYANIYPVCVSESSDDADFAASFAAFICYDKDARLLTSRLELISGYLPCINSGDVWNYYTEDGILGAASQIIFNNISNSQITPANINNDLYNSINTYISSYFASEIDSSGTASATFSLEDCFGEN